MARKSPPPPKCACSHLYAVHAGSGRCQFIVKHKHEDERDGCDKCQRCSCPKFKVPDGPGRKKKREQQETNALVAGAVASALTVPGAGLVVRHAMPGKRIPWWR